MAFPPRNDAFPPRNDAFRGTFTQSSVSAETLAYAAGGRHLPQPRLLAGVKRLVTVDGMDETLLAEARQAQERLIDAERDADVARAEFHRAVRRLHLHGASLRELASGLGLSHQRVHQIVEAAGGSRRWMRRDRARPDPGLLLCTFCGKNQKQVTKLIAGPGVYICNGCVDLAGGVIGSDEIASTGTSE